MATKKTKPKDTGRLPWITPGTASTWICHCGAVNSRNTTRCRKGC
jgi:hypothetical protein